MEVGQSTKALLDKKNDIAKLELMNMRKFYQTVTQFLQRRLPLNNELLRDITCLHPSMQKSVWEQEDQKCCLESVPDYTRKSSVTGNR